MIVINSFLKIAIACQTISHWLVGRSGSLSAIGGRLSHDFRVRKTLHYLLKSSLSVFMHTAFFLFDGLPATAMSVTRFPHEKNAWVEGLRDWRDRNPAHSDRSRVNLSHSVHA